MDTGLIERPIPLSDAELDLLSLPEDRELLCDALKNASLRHLNKIYAAASASIQARMDQGQIIAPSDHESLLMKVASELIEQKKIEEASDALLAKTLAAPEADPAPLNTVTTIDDLIERLKKYGAAPAGTSWPQLQAPVEEAPSRAQEIKPEIETIGLDLSSVASVPEAPKLILPPVWRRHNLLDQYIKSFNTQKPNKELASAVMRGLLQSLTRNSIDHRASICTAMEELQKCGALTEIEGRRHPLEAYNGYYPSAHQSAQFNDLMHQTLEQSLRNLRRLIGVQSQSDFEANAMQIDNERRIVNRLQAVVAKLGHQEQRWLKIAANLAGCYYIEAWSNQHNSAVGLLFRDKRESNSPTLLTIKLSKAQAPQFTNSFSREMQEVNVLLAYINGQKEQTPKFKPTPDMTFMSKLVAQSGHAIRQFIDEFESPIDMPGLSRASFPKFVRKLAHPGHHRHAG